MTALCDDGSPGSHGERESCKSHVHKVLVEAGALASTRAVGANDVHGQAASQGMDAASRLALKISALNVTVCLESDRYVCMGVCPCMYMCRSSWVRA